ncbi:MAG: MATE family efflux transporter [Cyanobacteria bacterium J06649_4]
MNFKMLPVKAVRQAVRAEVIPEGKAFLKLAAPLAAAQLAQFAVSFIDTIMMGRLGTESLAAGGLAASTFQMTFAVITGFVMSVGVLAAEAYGAGEKSRIVGLGRQGMWLALLLTVPFMLLLWNMTPILTLLQQPEAVRGLAQQYFFSISFGVLPALGFSMLRGYVSAFSLANVVTVIVVFGTLFNVACNYVLGFGKFGFPRLELVGLGLGSALSYWLMFGLFMTYILRHRVLSQYKFWRGWKHPKASALLKLVRVGWPIAITFMLELGLFAAVAYAAGSLGTEVLAAHQIAFQIMALIFMVPLGLSQAVTARVGLWLGRDDRVGMRRAGLVAIASTICFLTFSAIALYFLRPAAISLFIDMRDPNNAAVVSLATNLLLVSVIAQIIDGVQRVTMNALYGLQDTNVPMILSAIAYWGVGLTTSYTLCFVIGWGAVGLWIGQYTGVAIAGIIFVWRFWRLTGKSGARKHNLLKG